MKTFPNGYPTYKHTDGMNYSLPYHLPPMKRGPYRIEVEFKPAGTKLPVVSMRNAIFMGLRPTVLTLSQPMGIHKLTEEGHGTWMTSYPQEIEQHHRQLAELHGNVLVGGLGLGLAITLLEQNPRVKQVVVVEKSFDILALVGPHIPKTKTTLHHGDLYDYLKARSNGASSDFIAQFDCAFYDIWCPTGERILTEHVLPLRKLSEGVVKDRIECWNEDEMIGQIRLSCQTEIMAINEPGFPSLFKTDDADFQNYKRSRGLMWYFVNWMRKEKPTSEQAVKELDRFCAAIKQPERLAKKWKVKI